MMLKVNKTFFQKARLPFGVSMLVLGGFVLLGALADIPEQAFAADRTGNAEVKVKVDSVLILTVSPNADEGKELAIMADSKTVKTGIFTATVTSNQRYNISLNTKDDTTALVRSGSSEHIPIVGEEGATAVTSGVSSWGVRTCTNVNCKAESTDTNPYKAIGAKGKPVEFFSSGVSGGTDAVTQFEVGIGVASDLSSGDYTNHVVVTAAQF